MTVNLRPFPHSLAIYVRLSPLDYVLFVGKLDNAVPRCVPEGTATVQVFIDAPFPEDPAESLEFLLENEAWIKARAREWLISPAPLDVNPYIANSEPRIAN